MRSTGSDYERAGGFLRVENLPKGRGKSKAKQDIPAVIAGNGGRTDVVQTRTDLCNYVDNLG